MSCKLTEDRRGSLLLYFLSVSMSGVELSGASTTSSTSDTDPEKPDRHAISDSAVSLELLEAKPYLMDVTALHPTQLAVGMQQVGVKMAKVLKKRQKSEKKLRKWLKKNPVPVVIGPGGVRYLVDHHHLSRAVYEAGVKDIYVVNVEDLSGLDRPEFWALMSSRGYVWPFTHEGEQLGDLSAFVAKLPNTVDELKDDPYRSLAALVRRAGGYDKIWTPFSEFRWANFLRDRVHVPAGASEEAVLSVVPSAMVHASKPEAAHLPGYKGNAALAVPLAVKEATQRNPHAQAEALPALNGANGV